MIKALLVHNNIEGLTETYQSSERIQYDIAYVEQDFDPDLAPYDLLVVPCGTDQVAMLKIKDKVKAFLEEGKTVFCFDGWFTDWLPQNRWILDNSKKTIDIRYHLKDDPHGLFTGVDINSLIYSNGISGWWACGYIEASPNATVLLEDTWQRPIMVMDDKTTPGKMIMTASGPLSDKTYGTTDDDASESDIARLYHNLLEFVG